MKYLLTLALVFISLAVNAQLREHAMLDTEGGSTETNSPTEKETHSPTENKETLETYEVSEKEKGQPQNSMEKDYNSRPLGPNKEAGKAMEELEKSENQEMRGGSGDKR